MGSILSVVPRVAPPARPIEDHPAAASKPATEPIRVRIGGDARLGRPISQPQPKYPPIAVTAHIAGVVVVEAVVGVDGRVREVKAISGHPMLVPAALEAVRHWVYAPSTLNGDPIEIIAPITVTFRLN
jgi:protein TonB